MLTYISSLVFSSDSLPSFFLYACLQSPIRVAFPAYHKLLDFTTLSVIGDSVSHKFLHYVLSSYNSLYITVLNCVPFHINNYDLFIMSPWSNHCYGKLCVVIILCCWPVSSWTNETANWMLAFFSLASSRKHWMV